MSTANNQNEDLLLLKQIREENDPQAKDELVRKYIPMVKHIVKNQNCYYLEYEDLIQEGLIGLLKAINEFNGEFEIKFSTFAYICILRKIYNVLKRHSGKRNRLYRETMSLFSYVNSEESRTLLDNLNDDSCNPEELVVEKFAFHRLQEVLKAHLTEVEYNVTLLYLMGLTFNEIQRQLLLKAKVVDNAKTRARLKLQKIIKEYGSLLHPEIPLNTRKRMDLSLKLKVI
ncbi:MAG TPA: sigma-70 family RNA polymerase sigma factor [Bacillota bacterium]